MKNALILHGIGNDSQSNWLPWLKNKLEDKGYNAWSPDLPNKDKPVQREWLQAIFSNKNWIFNKESIIVGHSLGAILILRILENLPKGVIINKAILIAGRVKIGTNPKYAQYKSIFIEDPFRWNKIKVSANKFFFIHSDNDPYECGIENGIIMKKKLGGDLILKSGEAHFNLEKSKDYKKFPFILELIEK